MNKVFIALALLSLQSQPGSANVRDMKVIYGSDDRSDISHTKSYRIQEQARSVGLVIDHRNMTSKGDNVLVDTRSYRDEWDLCEDERFYDESAMGSCSGFLVADDIFVTAGHCIESKIACKSVSILFDYNDPLPYETEQRYIAHKSEVFGCEEVLQIRKLVDYNVDFTIIKLDRKVKNRKPLPYRKSSRVSAWTDVYSIGYPAGLSQKLMDNAQIRSNRRNSVFSTSLDSMIGASGSPVFNADSGKVEGMIISGEEDFELTPEGCMKSRVCRFGDSDCDGEMVQRFSEILPYLP